MLHKVDKKSQRNHLRSLLLSHMVEANMATLIAPPPRRTGTL